MDDLAALLALGAVGCLGLRSLIIMGRPPCRPVIDSAVSDYEDALNLAETMPNAHLLDSAREIRAGSSMGAAHASDGVITVDPSKMPRDRRERAAILIHEATHLHHGDVTSTPEVEKRAMEQENIARRKLGLHTINPNDFSRWEAIGFKAEPKPGAESVQQQAAPQPQPVQHTTTGAQPEQPKPRGMEAWQIAYLENRKRRRALWWFP